MLGLDSQRKTLSNLYDMDNIRNSVLIKTIHHYLFVTKNVARPESLSILSMGTIEVSSLTYLVFQI